MTRFKVIENSLFCSFHEYNSSIKGDVYEMRPGEQDTSTRSHFINITLNQVLLIGAMDLVL
jgi:hypothetical protein